ncbi:MAG: phospholipase D-like domain-containing protein, partial [Polyangiales bacterium]
MSRAFTSVLLGALLTSGCATTGRGALERPDERAEGSVRLILNDPTGRPAPSDSCDTEVCQALLTLLEGAQHSIDFAVYGIRNQTALVDALLAAQRRGVRIRGVVDRDREGHNYYASTDAVAEALGPDVVRSDHAAELAAAEAELDRAEFDRVPQCERPEGFEGPLQCLVYDLGDTCLVASHAAHGQFESEGDIMHNKFFVVDGRHVWTGSTNISDSGTGGYNANLVTVVDSERVATWFTEEFEQMYVHGRYHRQKRSRPAMETQVGDTQLELHFSPQDRPITRRVRRLIRDARERIDVAVFYLTHKGIAQDLISAHL